MKIKSHPRAYVIVYVDGRVDMEIPEKPSIIRLIKFLKTAMVAGTIEAAKKAIGENLEPGTYEFKMKKFGLRSPSEFDLQEV